MLGQSLCSELVNVAIFFLLLSVVPTQVLPFEKELGAVSVLLALCAAPSTRSPGWPRVRSKTCECPGDPEPQPGLGMCS